MKYFKHAQALVESKKIGDNTRVWAFAHILPGAKIGEDCNICDHVFIENDVIVGDRVTIKCGVQLWDGVHLEDDVFIGPNVTFTNDNFPRSKKYPDKFINTIVRKGASIGANASILAGITIGKNAMVGAGSVVTRDVPPNAIVMGNPARIEGYADSINLTKAKYGDVAAKTIKKKNNTSVSGVVIYEMPLITDMRGSLTFAEIGDCLPFIPKRYFMVFDVPSKDVRGEHAHKELQQFLICVRGSCSLVVDDGINREEILLNKPTIGVHLPPLVWGIQYKYTSDAMLLVLSSQVYDPEDYIRDYDVFLDLVKNRRP
jgi:UDP-2-acetamido-3-amino-2,3-dideoxy-glucuronate N-acetyltransferase